MPQAVFSHHFSQRVGNQVGESDAAAGGEFVGLFDQLLIQRKGKHGALGGPFALPAAQACGLCGCELSRGWIVTRVVEAFGRFRQFPRGHLPIRLAFAHRRLLRGWRFSRSLKPRA